MKAYLFEFAIQQIDHVVATSNETRQAFFRAFKIMKSYFFVLLFKFAFNYLATFLEILERVVCKKDFPTCGKLKEFRRKMKIIKI